ncbi:Delta(14)-sterol reductase [Sodiomyces alkalinus F11]|uniref:Delta(14)-sterol reductase n=1 Tax=Sodiomyces alkalinus (strain CBS 110278 / VKM F-3762 / F11) TaxID=1314773 RepID=A0A3N2PNV9_SODAK|nr:Delta(14)-sterol reductase [Sodiomyces alkalinus F11]ROT36183.1 Delta(14)-sterol reductase [Sodiomyces alkalinus F11]
MAPKSQQSASKAPPHGYHFGGPIGTFGITVILPVLVYFFAFSCNDVTGCPAPSLLDPRNLSLEQFKQEVGWPEEGILGLGSVNATLAVLGYYLLNGLLYRFLPAIEAEGVILASGGRLKYRFNSLSSNLVIISICLAGTLAQGAEWPVWVYIADNYIPILTANMLIAFGLATFVYVRSFSVKPGNKENRELAEGGASGNIIYDWFIGRELNPRVVVPIIGEIDIKQWMEVRPGLLGWSVLNFAFVAKQYRTFGFVSNSIVFISAIQLLYVVDCWYNEPAILTTIDITTDGFGFMLSFGDLVWVPFIYSTQTRYLSTYPVHLNAVEFSSIAVVISLAFYIFRASNSQKNMFRTNPNDPRVAHLKYLETKAGTRLITSGWWGIARHINYLGDWLQAWPYSLPTGVAGYQILSAGTGLVDAGVEGAFKTLDGREVVQGAARGFAIPITYFYVLYFAILLIHRDRRDDEKCSRKYGDDWEKYKKIVRWRILPGVY